MKTAHDIIVKPIITEDSMEMAGNKKYVFKVMKDASKTEIKYAVEEVFKVKVKDVNTINMPGKKKRLGNRPQGSTAAWKKAIVTLKPESDTIAFFDGMF
ncbi:MAG: 50S ribosomal protein L23 [Oscillospiraceae bacterium]|nr:50S ribosomal protein L23 [Oscillospiraceae bacterium]